MKSVNEMRPLTYDWATFTIATGQSDYSLKTNIAALFNNVKVARKVVLFFDKQISVKFNSTLMPAIVMAISRSPFQSPDEFIDVNDILITNASGATVTMEVLLW